MVKAPCRRNCCLDQDDICLGCGRSLSEITGWHQASAEQKHQILQQAELRLGLKDRLDPFHASRVKPS